MEVEKWHALIGRRSEAVLNHVEKGAVKKFAKAIGDPNPLYVDERAAAESGCGRVISPPTFPRTFDYGEIEGLGTAGVGLIHGEHRIRYEERPLFVEEEVLCHALLRDYYEKERSGGLLGFLIIEYVGETSEGRRIFSMEDTAILTPEIRERWRR